MPVGARAAAMPGERGGVRVRLVLDDVMRQVFERSLDGIVITNTDTVIVDVNPAYETITGYGREELLARPAGIVKSGRTPRGTYQDMWDHINRHGHWIGTLVNRRNNGEEWHAYISITRITDANGSTKGYVGILRDITERERTERVLLDNLIELAATQDVTVKTLALMAEHKDPDISGHLDRIQVYTRILSEELAAIDEEAAKRLDRAFIDELVKTSILHDIGKVAIPEGILFKPAKLSPEEFQVMQLHTRYGGQVLGQADQRLRSSLEVSTTFLTVATQIALHHHERWDGLGYPDKLKGKDIPLPARIIAVADVYDALTSRRVYKPAWSHSQARDLIGASAGKHFDPAVVEAFKRREREFDEIRRAYSDEVQTA